MSIEDDLTSIMAELDAWQDGYGFAAKAALSGKAPNVPSIIVDTRRILGMAKYEIETLRRRLMEYQQLLVAQAANAEQKQS